MCIRDRFGIDVDQRFDDQRHFIGIKGRADHLADCGLIALLAADGDLIPLLAILIDAEDADVGHMMMTAGIHATRNVERDVADVVEIVEIIKLALYRLGNRHRAGVGQCAKITAGAADHVGKQSDVGRGQCIGASDFPNLVKIALPDIGKHHVLLVSDTQFAKAETVSQIGNRFHL